MKSKFNQHLLTKINAYEIIPIKKTPLSFLTSAFLLAFAWRNACGLSFRFLSFLE